MCQITAFKVLLFVTPAPQLPALPLSQCVPRHSGNIKAKLGDRNGLFEGLYVAQTYHKPSVRLPNLSGNGAPAAVNGDQRELNVSDIKKKQKNTSVRGNGGNEMEQSCSSLPRQSNDTVNRREVNCRRAQMA